MVKGRWRERLGESEAWVHWMRRAATLDQRDLLMTVGSE